MTKKVTRNDLLDRLYSLYNDSVNLVGEYKGMFEETEFKCNICNHTWRDIPSNVLKRHGCLYCRCNDFINKSKDKFGEQFNYDCTKDTFIGLRKPCKFHCNLHDSDFYTQPIYHLNNKFGGCKKCESDFKSEIKIKSREKFIEEVINKFGNDRFTFNNTEYKGQSEKTIITCKKHGDIEIIPKDFLKTQYGCKKCAYENRFIDIDNLLHRLKEIHGDTYIYNDISYNGMFNDVEIVCKIHGKFKQTPHNHLSGQGCPICNSSKKENIIRELLRKEGIMNIEQKGFDYLKSINPMHLDFYIPSINTAIECQGEQHFRPIDYFGGDEAFKKQVERDRLKYDLCKEHGVNIIYFCDEINSKYYNGTEYIFFTNKNDLIKYIINVKNNPNK